MAINGYFMNGYSPAANAVGGTTVALPQDSMVLSANPAGMRYVAPGYDIIVRFLHPQRDAELDCRGIGACDSVVRDASSREFFAVPGFGLVRAFGERLHGGVALFGNGGLNTTFDRPVYAETLARIAGLRPGDAGFTTSGKVGVDFGQFIMAPGLSWRVTPKFDIGISPLLSVVKFKAYGLESFQPLSSDPGSLTNRDSEYVIGGGLRVGMMLELLPRLRLGAQYTTKLKHTRFDKYDGLFPDNGRFETPRHYAIGLAFDALHNLTVGVDVMQIQFATAAATGNSGPTANEFANGFAPARLLGGEQGVGFGWSNQTVVKAGVVYRFSDRLTFRLGWNGAEETTPSSQTLYGLIVPSAFRNHVTGGMTIRIGERSELSWGYMHAFDAERSDPASPLLGVPVKTNFAGDALDIGFRRRF
ncbi:MAG: hypothetical protein RLW62_04680 [Gammaproteobacteria bacterium]